jgi:hypothetical protein
MVLTGAPVHGKICRKHYCTPADKEFRDGVDSNHFHDTYIHDFTGRKMVRGYTDWFSTKWVSLCGWKHTLIGSMQGTEVFPGAKTEISWNHFHRLNKPRKRATMKMYYRDLNIAQEKKKVAVNSCPEGVPLI